GLVAWIVAGAALVNLALNAILVPAHGAMGAAWATALTFCALAIAAWMASERVAKPAFPLRRTLLPLALGAGAFLLGTQFAPSSAAFSYSIRGAFVVAAWCWVGFQARSLKAGPSGSGSEPR
ncbi:MAG: polysaccharide biosynthesis C-terminal domain-containing protein, partial [Planctomycetota bacterium]